MLTQVKGAIALRKALAHFTTDFALETQQELAKAMAPIARRARGFVPSSINLSGWQEGAQKGKWEYRAWSTNEAIAGIGYSATPSRPNRKGFTTVARIVNASAAGAIYETAGRKNPEGRQQGRTREVVIPDWRRDTGAFEHRFKVSTDNKKYGHSNNPFAGAQFIDAMNEQGLIVDGNTRTGPGRRGRKMKGRAIFRAWKEDGGKTNAAVNRAIEASQSKFYRTARSA